MDPLCNSGRTTWKQYVGPSTFRCSFQVWLERTNKEWWRQKGSISIKHKCYDHWEWYELVRNIPGDFDLNRKAAWPPHSWTPNNASSGIDPIIYYASTATTEWPQNNSIVVDVHNHRYGAPGNGRKTDRYGSVLSNRINLLSENPLAMESYRQKHTQTSF